MPTTTTLGLAVSSNLDDEVLEYWNKMLNVTDGNFVKLDNQFGTLIAEIPFTIPSSAWSSDEQGPFKYSATVTLSNTVVKMGLTVDAYFTDAVSAYDVVLESATQNGTDLDLVFYAISAKASNLSGVLKYLFGVEASLPTIDPVLNNNSWDVIALVCSLGLASNYWSVGDTKTDLGVDGVIRTFRIVDMQGLFDNHVVFEQVELEATDYQWNTHDRVDSNNCSNNYYNSLMRWANLGAIQAKYSTDLQDYLSGPNMLFQAQDGISSELLYLPAEILFLPAEKEIGAARTYSRTEEYNALTTFQYYTNHNTNSDRIKNQGGSASGYFLRSPQSGEMHNVCIVDSTGAISTLDDANTCGVAPCFMF